MRPDLYQAETARIASVWPESTLWASLPPRSVRLFALQTSECRSRCPKGKVIYQSMSCVMFGESGLRPRALREAPSARSQDQERIQ